jgi:hypothetical protein
MTDQGEVQSVVRSATRRNIGSKIWMGKNIKNGTASGEGRRFVVRAVQAVVGKGRSLTLRLRACMDW